MENTKRKIQKIIFLFIITVLFSCEKDPALFEISNLNSNEVLVFGHGGSGISWRLPMDTWESISKCLKSGADGAEIDIQMTKDSVLVAYHHEKLEDGTNCSGKISEKNWAEIEKCSFNAPFSNKYFIMKVDDIFNRIDKPDQYYFTFDCKFYIDSAQKTEYVKHYCSSVLKFIDNFQMEKNILIESPNLYFLYNLRTQRENLKLFIYSNSFENGIKNAETYHFFGITIDTHKITKENTDLAHSKGFRVALWNVEDQRDNLDALQKNPDYIQTDNIRHLLKITGKTK